MIKQRKLSLAVKWRAAMEVIKGFRKETELEKVIDILKDAGMPLDYGKEDLQIKEKAGLNTIKVQLK